LLGLTSRFVNVAPFTGSAGADIAGDCVTERHRAWRSSRPQAAAHFVAPITGVVPIRYVAANGSADLRNSLRAHVPTRHAGAYRLLHDLIRTDAAAWPVTAFALNHFSFLLMLS
jgi:hypothetical protein